MKISAGAENWASAEILTSGLHVRTRDNTIYEDLNKSSSAKLGGSQQLEILPSPNSKRAPNFSAKILWIGAEILEAQEF